MNKEELKRLCGKYYPVFTFDDGLLSAAVILTVFVIAAGISECPSAAELARGAVKAAAGWFGTVWVIGGKEYFSFLSMRIRLRKLLADDYDIILAECTDTNVRKENYGIYKRYKCSVRAEGKDHAVSVKMLERIITDKGKLYIIYPRLRDPKSGIVIPTE